MTSSTQTQSLARQPLSELPLHLFVSQSLDRSPKVDRLAAGLIKTPTRSRSPSLPRSQRSSLSVSPHKQAVLQSHRRVREGSVSSTSVLSSSSNISGDLESDQENSADVEVPIAPRKLFENQMPRRSSAVEESSLEKSRSLRDVLLPETPFSPKNVRTAPHHSPSVSRPSTPKDHRTTPLNTRSHRPPHTSGPKPTTLMEPSPSTQRFSAPRMSTGQTHTSAVPPSTPSRSKRLQHASPLAVAGDDPFTNVADVNAVADTSELGSVTPLEESSASAPTALLQSLPKKKHRVTRTEIAIAHEEAGAGPIGSPSPCKRTDYFSPPEESQGLSRSRSTGERRLSVSEMQSSVFRLHDLTQTPLKATANSLSLANSGLFMGVVAMPTAGWKVYEDPITAELESDCTAPSQDHPLSIMSSPSSSTNGGSPTRSRAFTPSNPNKENRTPDIEFFASKPVPIALPDRTYSAGAVDTKPRSSPCSTAVSVPSPVNSSRKRGTGGRLSLLANADADGSKDESTEADAKSSPPSATKKAKGRGILGSEGPSRASTRSTSLHQRKASGGRSPEAASQGRRRGSSHLSSPDNPRRVESTDPDDSVACRTRSRTRT